MAEQPNRRRGRPAQDRQRTPPATRSERPAAGHGRAAAPDRRNRAAAAPAGRESQRRPEAADARTAATAPAHDDGSEKLHKLLAQSGKGSRRDMEALIAAGRVEVNGQVATVGMRASVNDRIRIDGRPVRLSMPEELPQILIYHKPEGEIVSRDDPNGRASVFDRLPRLKGARWLSIGRLDLNTSGLLVFTTSGELANRLMHPRFEVEREYAVRVLGELDDATMRQLTQGIQLEDGEAHFDMISDEGGEGANHWYRVVIREGRNREVRRIFEAVGLTVSRLMRVRFGPINMPARLKRSMVLPLDDKQVRMVLKWAGMESKAPARQQRPDPRGSRTRRI